MRTLFIGNSHTFYNDMPNIFKEICKENGIDMQVAMSKIYQTHFQLLTSPTLSPSNTEKNPSSYKQE